MSATEQTALLSTTAIYQNLSQLSKGCCTCYKIDNVKFDSVMDAIYQLDEPRQNELKQRLKLGLWCTRLKQGLAAIFMAAGIAGGIVGVMIGRSQVHHVSNPETPAQPTTQIDNGLILTAGVVLATLSLLMTLYMTFVLRWLSGVAQAYSNAIETINNTQRTTANIDMGL